MLATQMRSLGIKPCLQRKFLISAANISDSSSRLPDGQRPVHQACGIVNTLIPKSFSLQSWKPNKIVVACQATINADSDTIDEISQTYLDKLLEQFRAADANGNGVLERNELRALLERVGDGTEQVPMTWLTENDLNSVFDRYDTNHDGVISFEEFQSMANDKIFLTGQLSEYNEAFKAFDSNKSGKLGPTEVYEMFKKLQSEKKDDPDLYKKIVNIFRDYDLDSDGEVDFAEFLRLFRNQLIDLKEILTYISTPEEAVDGGSVDLDVDRTEALTPGEVSTFFNNAEFNALLQANFEKITVVMASLTWCKPCKRINPQFKALAGGYPNCAFIKFFGNSNEETKQIFKAQLKCRVTPSFFFFKEGRLLGSCTGANAARLEDNLRKYMDADSVPAQRMFSSNSSDSE